ncbi:Btn2p KNAG_0B00700 [Huiozyma naganishii CBS 8797]|uniref:Uncharacterized protein n=1 Tax=Huiozyma naganishii (strain ATCC MYA-139 / BCRC 22969 / CBS 8797 / KCTC 17520 / NBRC 10181 / NCYC 3082 / Yp74L-3) TaxID=1071383 RepID=J7RG58_HUIN7|nr:hypothetical protein KNAG_0B00700 [Kazachstania naganishii CBS 8797]CCK68518.1 hypothetical protein KNAG_0B00700 [Kazachstania naganishii CBS 8797]
MIYNGFSPCIFQQPPVIPSSLLERCAVKQQSSPSMRLVTKEVEGGLLLTFQKQFDPEIYRAAVIRELQKLRDSVEPTYRAVTDFFGRQYYVANEISEHELLQKIDFPLLERQIAKQLFQDYSLELSHDGSNLAVSSKRDKLEETLQFEFPAEDIRVVGCGVLDDTTAFLRVAVDSKNNELENTMKAVQRENERIAREEQEEAAQRIRERKQAKQQQEQRLKKESEAREKRERIRVEKEKQSRLRRAKQDRQLKEKHLEQQQKLEQHKLEQQRQLEQQQREEELQLQKARDDEERREKLLMEQREYQRQLVEEEQQQQRKKLQASEAQPATSSAESVTEPIHRIDINFGGHTSSRPASPSNSAISETPRRRRSSPVLEDVDDDEISRYNRLKGRLPTGSAVVEDV